MIHELAKPLMVYLVGLCALFVSLFASSSAPQSAYHHPAPDAGSKAAAPVYGPVSDLIAEQLGAIRFRLERLEADQLSSAQKWGAIASAAIVAAGGFVKQSRAARTDAAAAPIVHRHTAGKRRKARPPRENPQ